jgi:molecular chaperone DnaK
LDNRSASSSQIVGIDLGTTYSLAAYVVDGRPQVVRNAEGVALVPSAINIAADGSVRVGQAAKDRAICEPESTIFSVKRLMGRTLSELAGELSLIPQSVVERATADGRKVLRVVITGHEYTPEELSAMILKEVRTLAGQPTKAVITVPAYFDDSQRQATRDAGRIAGLDVLRIVNEPTAAALAYGLDRKSAGTVVVYDLGGGTFDCSVLSLRDGVFRVLSTHGDTRLGGDDFDRTMITHVATLLGIDLRAADARMLQTLRAAAESAKRSLTAAMETVITIDAKSVPLTRADFEAMIEPLVARSIDRCRAALKDAKLSVDAIDDVVLVGGSTRVPLVREAVKAFFGRDPHTDLNPDEVVALGAAVQADILATGKRNLLLLDVVPLSLGVETMGGAVDKVVHRNSPVPCRETVRYTTFAEGQTAIQFSIYQGERELAKDCRKLGEFKLTGIPPMPAQMAQVDVTFSVDANGILTVTALEQRSQTQASVEVVAAHGLSKDDVESLVLESITHAREDFRARQLIELKAKADADLRHAAKAVAQLGDSITADERASLAVAEASIRSAMAGKDVNSLQAAVDAFGTATAPLAERLMNAAVKSLLEGKREQDVPGVFDAESST